MLSLFKRQKPVPPEPTCNDRIRSFWEWFQEVGPEFYRIIEERRSDDLMEITSSKVDELLPGFGWVYGPGADGKGHSLTLTGEGAEHLQFVALHWLKMAPVIDGWTFYAARQAGPIDGHQIHIDELKIDPKEIWVTPLIDDEDEHVDLTIWHPAWEKIEKKQQWTITFLFLDEALGEYGTKWWIGEIRLENDRLAESFPLHELPDYVRELSASKGWKKYPPGESFTLFRMKPVDEVYPRSDLITLTTSAPGLVRDEREAKGEMEDPFAGIGADYVYVSFPKGFLTPGEEVNERGNLEEALDAALNAAHSGRCLGGGFSSRRGYLDVLIFDGHRSLEIIVDTLKSHGLKKDTTIEYFVKEKREQRVRL